MKLKIAVLTSFIFLYGLGYSVGKSYVYIYNASKKNLVINGYKGTKPQWNDGGYSDGRGNKDEGIIKPNRSGLFTFTQAGVNTTIERFLAYSEGNHDRNDPYNYASFIIASTDMPKNTPPYKSVSYMSIIPSINTPDIIHAFYSVSTNKPIEGIGKRNYVEKGNPYLIEHACSEQGVCKFDRLATVWGIDSDGLVYQDSSGSSHAVVAMLVWYGDSSPNFTNGSKKGTSKLDTYFYDQFLSNYNGDSGNLSIEFQSWSQKNITDTTERGIANWYVDTLINKVPENLVEQIKHDQKTTAWENIIGGAVMSLANAFSISNIASEGGSINNIFIGTQNGQSYIKSSVWENSFNASVAIVKGITMLASKKLNQVPKPGGSYINSCSDVNFDHNKLILTANCKNRNQDETESTLNYFKCFSNAYGYGVDNNNGILTCEPNSL
jgi:hypothetical protein